MSKDKRSMLSERDVAALMVLKALMGFTAGVVIGILIGLRIGTSI